MKSAEPLDSPQRTANQASALADLPPKKMRRVASASFIGSMIEFYDFNIYGFAAALVFGPLFFPALGPAAATLASFATLGVAFVARPIGAIIFGHFGDRLGRKKTLIATLIIMGCATVLVGLMPTADQIGAAAPILLVALRILQGLAAGGEYAGAALFAAENSPSAKRGFWAMFASLGTGAGIMLAPVSFLLMTLLMSEEAFLSYGWRIPFLASILLVGVGLWMRLKMDETPVFKVQRDRGVNTRLPFVEALKRQPRTVLKLAGIWLLVSSTGYLGASFLTNYGRSTLGLSFNDVLAMGTVGGGAFTIGVFISGYLSDFVGRRRLIIVAAVSAIVWSLAMFPILDTGSVFALGLGMAGTMLISGIGTGPLSAYSSELFDTSHRYTATALANTMGGIVGGGLMPIIGVSIVAAFGGFAFGLVLSGFALLSLICVLRLPETKNSGLNDVSSRG